jgi:hypothetical protein
LERTSKGANQLVDVELNRAVRQPSWLRTGIEHCCDPDELIADQHIPAIAAVEGVA